MKIILIPILLLACLAIVSADTYRKTKTVVLYHYGDDYKAGDDLNDLINETNNGSHPRREILLKCKHAGCKFFLNSPVEITAAFKIRGELNKGLRPVIFNNAPFRIALQYYGIFEVERVNFKSNGHASSQSHIIIDGDADDSLVFFNECDFLSHNVGFNSGGAFRVEATNQSDIRWESCKFKANAAKIGGAIFINGGSHFYQVEILNCDFVSNAAIEKGGAIYIEGPEEVECPVELRIHGCHFHDNTANKKGDTFVGQGGALYVSRFAGIQLYETRTWGGNQAKFGNFAFLTNYSVIDIKGFGCYEGPYVHAMNDGYQYGYDPYRLYPACAADSYDAYAPKEDIFIAHGSHVRASRIDLPGGFICAEDDSSNTVTRHGCGSHVYAYHCLYGDDDHYVEAEDYDRDGFDCRYDCNDVWDTVNPAAGEHCNATADQTDYAGRAEEEEGYLKHPRSQHPIHILRVGDDNCNGLVDEHIDTDGDHVPDWYDQCPQDYYKLTPGRCGCGLEDSESCGASAQQTADGCQTVEENGVWYYLCASEYWYWDSNQWAYGGTY